MLRPIKTLFFILLLPFAAQGLEKDDSYIEPTTEELLSQKQVIDSVLKKADELQKNKKFISDIKRQQQSLSTAVPGAISSYDVPDYVDQARQKRYLKHLFDGGLSPAPDTELPERNKPIVLISLTMPTDELRSLLRELRLVGSGAVV